MNRWKLSPGSERNKTGIITDFIQINKIRNLVINQLKIPHANRSWSQNQSQNSFFFVSILKILGPSLSILYPKPFLPMTHWPFNASFVSRLISCTSVSVVMPPFQVTCRSSQWPEAWSHHDYDPFCTTTCNTATQMNMR